MARKNKTPLSLSGVFRVEPARTKAYPSAAVHLGRIAEALKVGTKALYDESKVESFQG